MNALVDLPAAGQLHILKQADLTTLQIPPRELLLGEWMTERHPCLVYGQTGRGKSLFAMSLAMAVAGGGEVFGWRAPEALPVLYVDSEMDIADVVSRDHLLKTAINDLDLTAMGGNLRILSRHHQPHGVTFPDLVEPEGQAALVALVREFKPALVVLDNLSTLADIRDENDAAAFTPVLETLWKLRQAGCAVILVHHTGKQEGKYRGSSKLAAPFESVLQLAPNSELLRGDTGFQLRVDKCRSGIAPEGLRVQLKVDADTGEGRWDYGGAEERKLQELVAAVRSREYGYAKDVAEALGLSAGETSKRKKQALLLGLITGEEWDRCLQEARNCF